MKCCSPTSSGKWSNRSFLRSRQHDVADDRACFEGILWVLRSGACRKDLPDWCPSPSTCWRRLAEWKEAGLFVGM
ncbi:transposase [Bremerella cremea]|uniref:Transposase n=1 Tax=Bremerella cremea TaxID=1031537 RepID=A0A368KQN3_9BACT|nr:transposase [Bremerella cremea]